MVQFRLRTLWFLGLLMGLVASVYFVFTVGSSVAAPPNQPQLDPPPDFGANTYIFDPSMTITDIQTTVNNIASQQVSSEMGTNRYALLFKPGTYGTAQNPLVFQVGFYTEVAGLGQSPTDVVINGNISVLNQCSGGNCIALDNFWRSLSNLTINVAGNINPVGGGCYNNTEFWAVSQAAPLRRVNINGGFTFMDYCTGPSYASGGFMADSKATASVVNGSQQQFFVRNSQVGGWSNGVWNQVFAGVTGAPAQHFTEDVNAANPYTTLATNPASREKPFLTYDGSNYGVFVPNARTNSSGTTWTAITATAGITLPISTFFVAKPTDTATAMNAALASGQNLLFTPGIYHLNQTLLVNNPDTVVLGLGLATLVPDGGIMALNVGDVAGVKIAGLLIDAGTVNSPVLLKIGSSTGVGLSSDPTTISDVFLRVGGATVGKATTAMIINTDYTILDDIWAWRADHGNVNTFGWTLNTSDTGVIVNGANVLATGLFVEHFQKYQTIWNGENGKTIFYQSEMPYDPPTQADYTHDGVLGYASYKVADNVQVHDAWGVGVYSFFKANVDPTIHNAHAFEVPNYHPGINFHDLVTVSLGGGDRQDGVAGIIDHIINFAGPPSKVPGTNSVNLLFFHSVDGMTFTSVPNPSDHGQTITLTATVAPISASGKVTFTTGIDVTTTLGSANLVNGTASITTTAIPSGNNTLTATYGGDSTYSAQALTVTQVVNYITTTLSLTSNPNPSNIGQTVTFTATVNPVATDGPVSGTVTFTEGASVLGTAPGMSNTSSAVFTTSTLPVGNHNITAMYSGDAVYGTSTSPGVLVQVVCPASLTVIFNTDDGTGTNCGTLSFALSQPITGTDPITITFALQSGDTITFTGGLSPTIKVKPYVVLSGGTFGSDNRVIINGNSQVGDGLVLQGHNLLENLTVESFGGREIVTEGTDNRLRGVKVVS